MSLNVVKLADKDDMDRNKALDAALTQIERAFGKGSIMRLRPFPPARSASISRSGSAVCRVGASLKSTARKVPARPPWHCM